jgi:apolipoprotein N-acyltransferase
LLALATRAQRIRRGAWLGALHGAAFFIPLLHWTGLHVGPGPWLLLAGVQTVFLAILGAAAAGSSRFVAAVPWSAPVVTAVLWVGQEALRSRLPFGGFPWGRIAFAQDDSPLLRLASLGGAPLVTFAVALAGGLLAAAAVRPWRAARLRQSLRAVALIASAVVVCGLGLVVPITQPGGNKVTVAVIQGNVPRLGLDFNAQRRQVLENHVETTRALARRVAAGREPQPDLVIWPENSSDIDPLVNSDAGELISTAAAEIDAPILVGAVLEGPGRFVTNAAIVWDPRDGAGDRYAKRHPVPFAEYVPMRGVARAVTDKVDLVRRDFKGGDEVGALRVGPAEVGDVICFEVAYDALVRDTVTAGAELIVVQTNNATFDKSAESAQQLAMVRLRAVEHGRAAIMSSTSGVSATVTADGEVLDESGLFTRATFVRALRLGEHRTLATTVGGAPELVLSLAGLVPLVAGVWLRRRARGHADGPATVEPSEVEGDESEPERGAGTRNKQDREQHDVEQHKEDA